MKVRIDVLPQEEFDNIIIIQVWTWEQMIDGPGWDFANIFDFDNIDEIDLNGVFNYCFFYEEDREAAHKFDGITYEDMQRYHE